MNKKNIIFLMMNIMICVTLQGMSQKCVEFEKDFDQLIAKEENTLLSTSSRVANHPAALEMVRKPYSSKSEDLSKESKLVPPKPVSRIKGETAIQARKKEKIKAAQEKIKLGWLKNLVTYVSHDEDQYLLFRAILNLDKEDALSALKNSASFSMPVFKEKLYTNFFDGIPTKKVKMYSAYEFAAKCDQCLKKDIHTQFIEDIHTRFIEEVSEEFKKELNELEKSKKRTKFWQESTVSYVPADEKQYALYHALCVSKSEEAISAALDGGALIEKPIMMVDDLVTDTFDDLYYAGDISSEYDELAGTKHYDYLVGYK